MPATASSPSTTGASQAKSRLAGHLRLVPSPELIAPVELVAKPTAAPPSRQSAPPAPTPTPMRVNLRQRLARLAVIRHAAIGVALEVMEGVRAFLAPAAFCLRNARWVAMGLLTFIVPPLVAFGLWSQIPGWSEGFPLTAALSWGFLGGLTVAIGFGAAIVTVLIQSVCTGVALAARHVTSKGQNAF